MVAASGSARGLMNPFHKTSSLSAMTPLSPSEPCDNLPFSVSLKEVLVGIRGGDNILLSEGFNTANIFIMESG